MVNQFSSKLIKVKSELIQIMSEKMYGEFDAEQLEYLIQYIDWMILGKVDINITTVETLMEEIVITSVHQVNFALLDTLADLCEIVRELYAEIQL